MKDCYVLSIDQSTQGTKALLFSANGSMICRSDLPHRQIVSENGWISHDPNEIYRNLLQSARNVVSKAEIDADKIACIGISNQRETTIAWDRKSGRPVCDAIVWQCSRSHAICERLLSEGNADLIQKRTGIPISPYFPASKLRWIIENIPGVAEKVALHEVCFGTVDAWLIYNLTNGLCYKTDYSNASRTQLFNIHTRKWDEDICRLFGIEWRDLPEVCDSDSEFGLTDLGGFLHHAIPICGVLGDSNAALFGQGCLKYGMAKATYGTGSSVMMNIGETPVFSESSLATSLAWRYRGRVQYVMEGNLNYTGAVVRWLQNDVGLFDSAMDTQCLSEQANPNDTTYLVPAFTGLGAPYWDSTAKALLCGITRLTGRAEIVKAGIECIAYQITDIVKAMERDIGVTLQCLQVDGGGTNNKYLMQFQSDILGVAVQKCSFEELSGMGAAYMAGISFGILNDAVMQSMEHYAYIPQMSEKERMSKYEGWLHAVKMALM